MTGRKNGAKGMDFDAVVRVAIETSLQDERNPDNPITRAALVRVRDCVERIGERIAEPETVGGLNPIIEVKGQVTDKADAKAKAAERWISAVNRLEEHAWDMALSAGH